ncbi:MAG: DUF4968 domain-containing protein, partial [Prevotella sp.]|nr:DUF4968 domain-containing protein [Prevotella sp.]
MKHIHFILLAALCMCTSSTLASNYEKRGNAVTIHLTNPDAKSAKLVRLEVVSDKIIRVRATPEEQFPTKTSLMIVPQHSKAKYNVTETDGNVIVKTSAVQAIVNSSTGHISFLDANGKQLLSEIQQKGKSFEHFYVPEREIGVGT